MTSQQALLALLALIELRGQQPFFLGQAALDEWPPDMVTACHAAKLFRPASPAGELICRGCENQCLREVQVRPSETAKPARVFIVCNMPEDMGRIDLDLRDLNRWQCSGAALAGALAMLLNSTINPRSDNTGVRWNLGHLPSHSSHDDTETTFILGGESYLRRGSIRVGLRQLLMVSDAALALVPDALAQLVGGENATPAVCVGSVAHRKASARHAINTRHGRPGGANEKHAKLFAAWASGKYSTKDRCADQEAEALGMEISTARRVLTKAPRRPRS